jgi:uncharacterized membrane protein YfcA
MQSRKFHLALVIAAITGGLVVRFVPSDWFYNVFGCAVGLGIALALLTNLGAKDVNPLETPEKVASYLLLGTSRPNAIIKESLLLRSFLVVACFDASMLIFMILI